MAIAIGITITIDVVVMLWLWFHSYRYFKSGNSNSENSHDTGNKGTNGNRQPQVLAGETESIGELYIWATKALP